MPRRYAEIYPSLPLLSSDDMAHVSAAALMSVRYFRAEPDTMPEEVFAEHYVLLKISHRLSDPTSKLQGLMNNPSDDNFIAVKSIGIVGV